MKERIKEIKIKKMQKFDNIATPLGAISWEA
jgi:hypothetical protein